MANSPYGYWDFMGKNGLAGGESTLVELPDGSTYLKKDPDFPAVLDDEFIVFAVKNSPVALNQFYALFPTMDAVSQARLRKLMNRNKFIFKRPMGGDDLAISDAIQKKEVTAGIHVTNPPGPVNRYK